MTINKYTRRQACWVGFLLGFNFDISYTIGKKIQIAKLFIWHPNDVPLDDNNDCQQYWL